MSPGERTGWGGEGRGEEEGVGVVGGGGGERNIGGKEKGELVWN